MFADTNNVTGIVRKVVESVTRDASKNNIWMKRLEAHSEQRFQVFGYADKSILKIKAVLCDLALAVSRVILFHSVSLLFTT